VLTFHGITIDSSELSENADDYIHFETEFGSNGKDETPEYDKNGKQRSATLSGITID
jgi:hypothetical protein